MKTREEMILALLIAERDRLQERISFNIEAWADEANRLPWFDHEEWVAGARHELACLNEEIASRGTQQ